MTGPNPTLNASIARASLDGQLRAERFLSALPSMVPAGDELYEIVSQYTCGLPAESSAYLRSFLRRCQKELEACQLRAPMPSGGGDEATALAPVSC